MPKEIPPQYLSLNELLSGRLFRIPAYQRDYRWGSRQLEDMFKDIRALSSKGDDSGNHFMATVVCHRREEIVLASLTKYGQVDIVDGQQRLTTLIILLNACRKALDEDGQQTAAENLARLLIKEGGDHILLQTNHDTSHYFEDFLRSDKSPDPDDAETGSDRALLEAIQKCNKQVQEWREKGGLADLVTLVRNRLYFILLEIEDEQIVYTTFETLNSRGLEVSWLDRLKSKLMGKAYELRETRVHTELIKNLQTKWSDIYRTIAKQSHIRKIANQSNIDAECLQFAATLYYQKRSELLSEEKSVETLVERASDGRGIEDVADWVFLVTKAYCKAVALGQVQEAVMRISPARLLAIAIHLRDFKHGELNALLEHWQKITFRIYGLKDLDARRHKGPYIHLACRVCRNKSGTELTPDQIHKELDVIGSHVTINDAIRELRDRADCFTNWRDDLRFFMYRREEYLVRKKQKERRSGVRHKERDNNWSAIWAAKSSRSIEHIFPQKTAPNDFKHRLGNLMLLPPEVNSGLQVTPPMDKRQAYRDTGLLIADEVAGLLDGLKAEGKEWGEEAVEKRGEDLLRWAETEWGD